MRYIRLVWFAPKSQYVTSQKLNNNFNEKKFVQQSFIYWMTFTEMCTNVIFCCLFLQSSCVLYI